MTFRLWASLQVEVQKEVQREKVHEQMTAAKAVEAAGLAELSRQRQVQARISPFFQPHSIKYTSQKQHLLGQCRWIMHSMRHTMEWKSLQWNRLYQLHCWGRSVMVPNSALTGTKSLGACNVQHRVNNNAFHWCRPWGSRARSWGRCSLQSTRQRLQYYGSSRSETINCCRCQNTHILPSIHLLQYPAPFSGWAQWFVLAAVCHAWTWPADFDPELTTTLSLFCKTCSRNFAASKPWSQTEVLIRKPSATGWGEGIQPGAR